MRSSHHHKHHVWRLLCLTALACFVAGGTAYACTRKAAVPQLPELPAESLAQPAENGAQAKERRKRRAMCERRMSLR